MDEPYFVVSRKEKAQLYDRTGKALSTDNYKDIRTLNPHLFKAQLIEPKGAWIMLDKQGTPINQEQYSSFGATSNSLIAAEKNLNGNIRSCLLDTLGRELDCYPYKAVLLPCPDSDLLIAQDLYDFGVVSQDGKELAPFFYKKILCLGDHFIALQKGDYINDLMTKEGELVQRDIKGYLKIEELGNGRFLLLAEEERILMDRNGQFIGRYPGRSVIQIGDIHPFSENFLKGTTDDRRAYYISTETGKAFKD